MGYICNPNCKFPFSFLKLRELSNSTWKTLVWLCTTYMYEPWGRSRVTPWPLSRPRSPVHNWLIPSQETNYDESHLISFFTFSYFDPKHWLVSLNLVGIIFRFLWCDWLIVFKWLGDSSDIVNESTAKNLTEKIEN